MKKSIKIVALSLTLGLTFSACKKEASNQPNEQQCPATTECQNTCNKSEGSSVKAASVDHMKMVVDNQGNVLGRYVATNEDTYTVTVQDDGEVPKEGNSVVTFCAQKGQGIVYTERKNVNVRTKPDLNAPAFTQISTADGDIPEPYPCLGKEQDWYKIEVNGKVGYVRHDLVMWDGMCTF
ncbi:MAG: hypothetical protein J6P49_03980 [Paludibacteraceae bacterium]|nr:hypothetical protein [Paludibacteraceae bacterium]MBO7337167.1 hypothetical protein [Paludibacteraceae bacterium]MBP5136630.1 hypothetical protein [Paludibacteraceae bacterium]